MKQRAIAAIVFTGICFAAVAVLVDPFGQIGIGLISGGYLLDSYTRAGNGEKHGG